MSVLRRVWVRLSEDYVGADVGADLEGQLGDVDWDELDSLTSFKTRSPDHGLDYIMRTVENIRHYVFFRAGSAVGFCTMRKLL